ncbi:MAG: PEP-CTERM sorting domain-containing protein [Acidobacteria bacterium]|nr:PEP-CTERM sorting domain-containing protein [Acidobacteriota bacterium]
MKKTLRAALTMVAASLAAGQLWADVITGALTYAQPTGTVTATESIPMLVTFTADPSYALVTDASGTPLLGGPSLAQIIANLDAGLPSTIDPTVDTLRIALTNPFRCGGTFTTVCLDGPPYSFDFFPGYQFGDLNIPAGGSFTFNHGSFNPTGGKAPAGTYTYDGSMLGFVVLDLDVLDSNGNATWIAYVPLGDAAASGSSFTRTVLPSSVPEPGSMTMIGLAVAALALRLRRG